MFPSARMEKERNRNADVQLHKLLAGIKSQDDDLLLDIKISRLL